MTVLSGSELRDEIARVLRSKYRNVDTEVRLECTTADVVYVDDTNSLFLRRIAIEAKDWAKPLTSYDIAEIENLYRPSLHSRNIDYLWIIGNHVLGSSPADSIKMLNWTRYSSLSEFRSSMMNFSGIIFDNILEYRQAQSSFEFIQTRVNETDITLFSYTKEWLEKDKSGLVVFGGYGLGKTTFSMYLASRLSEDYNKGEFKRIPIRILLGRMYTKQDIQGLICSALSGGEGKASVRDFSYNLFLEANAAGSYLLIFDGFDEMKHAMTIDDFIFTFEQMKPLFKGQAKVILLGRPDAFLSSTEEHQVLSSLFDTASNSSKYIDKVEISFFNNDEIRSYLDAFIKTKPEFKNDKQLIKFNSLVNRLLSESDVLNRPVQLKMFTEILDNYIDYNSNITRYELYRQFIFKFIIRESRKDARKISDDTGIPNEFTDERAQFMMNLAWWVLAIKKENKFLADEISINLIPKSIRMKRDGVSALRESIIGSVIEPLNRSQVIDKKGKRYYFFPHKSYIEFLFAQYFVMSIFDRQDFAVLFKSINPEILSFIAEGPKAGITKLRTGLSYTLGKIDINIVNVCLLDEKIAIEITNDKSVGSSASIYIAYLYTLKNYGDASEYITKKLSQPRGLESFITCVNCVVVELASRTNNSLAQSFLTNVIAPLSLLEFGSLQHTFGVMSFYHEDVTSFCAAIMKNSVTIDYKKQIFVINVANLRVLVERTAGPSLFIDLSPLMGINRKIHISISSISKFVHSSRQNSFQSVVNSAQAANPFSRIALHGEALKRFGEN